MPGIQLYQSEQDEIVLVTAAVSNGYWLVPDLHYESAKVDILRTVEDFQSVRKREYHFFILHESFLRIPLCLRKIEKNGKDVFYVSQTEGGPFLEFLGGGIFKDKQSGKDRIRPGFLEYRSGYWDQNLTA